MSPTRLTEEQWMLAFTLYARGVHHQQIVVEVNQLGPGTLLLGTLRKRIVRDSWVSRREKANALMPARQLTIQERSEVVRFGLASDLETSVAKLPDLKRSTIPEIEKERVNVVAGLASTASKVFGWESGGSGQQQRKIIDIETLASAKVCENHEPKPDDMVCFSLPGDDPFKPMRSLPREEYERQFGPCNDTLEWRKKALPANSEDEQPQGAA
jgi:hypothetical protein